MLPLRGRGQPTRSIADRPRLVCYPAPSNDQQMLPCSRPSPYVVQVAVVQKERVSCLLNWLGCGYPVDRWWIVCC
jgi:hypothetical protein